MKKIEKITYQCEYDGMTFDSEAECTAHEIEIAGNAFEKFIKGGGHVAFANYNYTMKAFDVTDFSEFLDWYDNRREIDHMLVYVSSFGDYGWSTIKELFMAVRMSGHKREICYRSELDPMLQNVPDMQFVNGNITDFKRVPYEYDSDGVFIVNQMSFNRFLDNLLGLRTYIRDWIDVKPSDHTSNH